MAKLTPEEEANKRAIYEKLGARQKKFVDRKGYENWDPFLMPNDPMDIRQDPTKRTTQELVSDFLKTQDYSGRYSTAYAAGAWELALGIINKQDRFLGMYEFSVWYGKQLEKQGIDNVGHERD
ncbi:MAG: hypothetical protein D6E12_17330 [Desulfovibrio sp.]|nr:MAG: hypothetical protein D6E12_17330 [Desulfovibrio sp.]